ncbi:MAG: hypothetical protein R2865_01425 [Deinococcales bacterium]
MVINLPSTAAHSLEIGRGYKVSYFRQSGTQMFFEIEPNLSIDFEERTNYAEIIVRNNSTQEVAGQAYRMVSTLGSSNIIVDLSAISLSQLQAVIGSVWHFSN